MSNHRMTVNTQQLLDVLIITIQECAIDAEVITMEEVGAILRTFTDTVYDHIEDDDEPDEDVPDDVDDPNVPE